MRRLRLIVLVALALHLVNDRRLSAQERAQATDVAEQAVALGVGIFPGVADDDLAFLHLLGAYERPLTASLDLVAEAGVVVDENDLFAAIAPALRLDVMPLSRPSLFVRAGPAFLGTTSGFHTFAHLGGGLDLATASGSVRLEARTYIAPSEISFDVWEIALSYGFNIGEP